MLVKIIIPARFDSSRFPGKPLVMINGKSMIQRVYEQCKKSIITDITVATDNKEIYNHIKSFGGKAKMTGKHTTGTIRCYEATKNLKNIGFIINVQGDQPFIDPAQINYICQHLTKRTEILTLIKKITKAEAINSNTVKAVISKKNTALYFSRAAIPYNANQFYKHIGIYAFRYDILKKISLLKPSSIEMAETLEQLGWLYNGLKINTLETDQDTISIDVREDLKKIT